MKRGVRHDECLRPWTQDLTDDQKLKLAEVKALLAIGQELSRIHHNGINPEYLSEAE